MEPSYYTYSNKSSDCILGGFSGIRYHATAMIADIKEVVRYQKDATAWFFSKADPRWLLSNMAGQMPVFWPLQRNDANFWNSSEQLYQASKYGSEVVCLPQNADASTKDPRVRHRIRKQKAARGAKMTQKCAVSAGLVRGDWEHPETEVRIKAMLWVLELKLYWNPLAFGRELKETRELPIIEISTKDDFWGCKETGAGIIQGRNVLGKLLMQVRSRLETVKSGQFTYPEGWLLP
jgi:predicted NAD-dependent protein-ADP-ribosyltransferase YbiA (DUF1768 family)